MCQLVLVLIHLTLHVCNLIPPPLIPKHQGSTVTEHPLEEIWMEHIVPVEGILHSIHNM